VENQTNEAEGRTSMQWRASAVEMPGQKLHVLVTAEAPDDSVRSPVLLNLLLDRSGSMKGAPLSAAVEAVHELVEMASPEDCLGLLIFDGVAEQRVALTMMSAPGKRLFLEALKSVSCGRGTALHQAVELGLKSLQRTLVPGRRPRLLILTDGEPSVGPDTQEAFDVLGERLAKAGVSVHALGLAKHYVADILTALTKPSGNAFEHVDGPEGLRETLSALVGHIFGHAATDAQLRVQPRGFAAVTSRHGFQTQVEKDELVIQLGDVSRGMGRRLLLTGQVLSEDWDLGLQGRAFFGTDTRHQAIEVEVVEPDSSQGRLVVGTSHELEVVQNETGAWLSMARKDLARAELLLEAAEEFQLRLEAAAPLGIAYVRHRERLEDLRLAVERGEGDIPLLIRRAQSIEAGTHVSQVLAPPPWRIKK
jgi:Ca-activated chloride channel homolog